MFVLYMQTTRHYMDRIRPRAVTDLLMFSKCLTSTFIMEIQKKWESTRFSITFSILINLSGMIVNITINCPYYKLIYSRYIAMSIKITYTN